MSEYPVWPIAVAAGSAVTVGLRCVYGLVLARMAIRHGQPLTVSWNGAFRLGEVAITGKAAPAGRPASRPAPARRADETTPPPPDAPVGSGTENGKDAPSADVGGLVAQQLPADRSRRPSATGAGPTAPMRAR